VLCNLPIDFGRSACLQASLAFAALNKWFKKGGDSKARRAHWQQFDGTHHWDASADDWVRNDGQRPD
jgi:hypothetical protein